MPTMKTSNLKSRKNQASAWYEQADRYWSRHRVKLAFPLFLAAAKAGHKPAFRITGQFYDCGSGVKRNEDAALFWYMRAYRLGDRSATNNIGCIWRMRGQLSRSLAWFRRAVKLGDGDANLCIADVYMRQNADLKKIIRQLQATVKAKHCTQGSKDDAAALLKKIAESNMSTSKIFR